MISHLALSSMTDDVELLETNQYIYCWLGNRRATYFQIRFVELCIIPLFDRLACLSLIDNKSTVHLRCPWHSLTLARSQHVSTTTANRNVIIVTIIDVESNNHDIDVLYRLSLESTEDVTIKLLLIDVAPAVKYENRMRRAIIQEHIVTPLLPLIP